MVQSEVGEGESGGPGRARRRGLERSRWWTALATVLIVLGGILGPAGLVAGWARAQLTDTNEFVSTFAPLAREPAVRSLVTAKATEAITTALNVKELTANAVDGISSLGLGPRARAALKALEGPAADGIEELIRSNVRSFVDSDAFADLWTRLLRTSHVQLLKTMQGSPQAAVTIERDGTIGLQLGPIVSEVKQRLVSQGVSLAERIPSVDRTIVLTTSSSAPALRTGYALAVGLGAWLPWVALGLLVAGLVVARRRAVATFWTGIALGVPMLLVLAALGAGRAAVVRALARTVPRGAALAIFDQLAAYLAQALVALSALGIAIALVAWLAGPFRPSVALRRGIAARLGRPAA